MVKSVEAGQGYQTAPAIVHDEEYLQSGIDPDLHGDAKT